MAKAPIVDELGHRIRSRRKSIGMTQADLALAIGVSFQQVQKYEKGINTISPHRLQQICDVMNLPPQYFLDNDAGSVEGADARSPAGMNGAGHADAVAEFLASGEGKRLIQSFISITDQKLRTRILDFIASVATDRPR